MDEYTADAFANRDDPIPLLSVEYSDVDVSSSELDSERKRDRLKKTLSGSRLREKAQNLHAAHTEKMEKSEDVKVSIQDRVFAKILQQIIPAEDIQDEADTPIDRRSSKYVKRPAFSLPVMTNNFRRFNARIGIVFVFQNRLIRLFTWQQPTHTLSFLATYTFICLNPNLLVVLPFVITLLFIMVPAFISRHPPAPPPKSTSNTTPYYSSSYSSPALAPPRTIRPASETSKDFFRNMRDLQNSMADFSNLHDTLVAYIAPVTNFSDEVLSSTVFLYFSILTSLLFISAQLLPIRMIFLLAGYTTTVSSHPTAQKWLLKMQKRAEKQAALALSDPNFKTQKSFQGIPLPTTPQAIQQTITSLSAITLSTTLETREVEIFELQHRPMSSHLGLENLAEWQPHLFTPNPYDPLSPSRISGDRPKGTRFFEDVQPPEGWEWEGKKWELDLDAGEWINERLVVGVEYGIVNRNTEDSSSSTAKSRKRDDSINSQSDFQVEFGGWVWDLPPAPGTGGNRDEEVWLAYGDYDVPSLHPDDKKGKNKGHKKGQPSRDWEETTRYGSSEGGRRTGEWRRRRWVRMVRRKIVDKRHV